MQTLSHHATKYISLLVALATSAARQAKRPLCRVHPIRRVAATVAVATVAAAVTACGGGIVGDNPAPMPADKQSIEYKQWLWVDEGGKPGEFTLAKFCAVQPEHCTQGGN